MKPSKALIRSMDRRGSRSDKSPRVAQKTKFREPSVCDRCGAVYVDKTWRRGPRLEANALNKARWVRCPACAQAETGEYYGRVLIEVGDIALREAIDARINNVDKLAQVTQPERRIVSTEWNGNTLEVLTTSQKLAHRIVHEVGKAFGGVPHFSWSHGDGSLFATLRIAPKLHKHKKSK